MRPFACCGDDFSGAPSKTSAATRNRSRRDLPGAANPSSTCSHAEARRELVADPVTDGPFAGWTRLDEVRSEVVTIVRLEPEPQGIGPARVQAATHAWFAGTRLRKSPDFGRWVNEVLTVGASRPRTAFDWMHVATGARSLAESGGILHYLYRPVALEEEVGTPGTRPHQGR